MMVRAALFLLISCVVSSTAAAQTGVSGGVPGGVAGGVPGGVSKQGSPARTEITGLMVEVTISRYQGDKRISSLPYTVAASPDNQRHTLRVGGEVPIPSTTFTPVGGPPKDAVAGGGDTKLAPLTSYGYRSIGTNIDVVSSPLEDGRYRVGVTVEESSIYPPGETAKSVTTVPGVPAFRSLRSQNTLVLRDGQSVEYTAATDRISGEVARISVKLTVVK
jgi:Flp pilus assembly secretin CpaC